MAGTERTVSRPTVVLMSVSFVAFLLTLVPGLSAVLLVGGVPVDTALLLGMVLLSLLAFMTAVLDKSLSSTARMLWAVAAALVGCIQIFLVFVLLTLLFGP